MENKKMCIFLILILIFLICNFIYNILDVINFETVRKSGDDKWKIVEKRIIDIETRVEILEDYIYE